MKNIIILMFLSSLLFASDLLHLPIYGVETIYKDSDGKDKKINIEREVAPECYEFGLTPEALWSKDFTSSEVPKECKKDFVVTKGTIQPMSIHPKVETYAELEVLDFIKKMNKSPDKYLLIDSRTSNWYELQTIPGAINIPYNEFYLQEFFELEYERALELIGVKENSDKTFDVSGAKTILLFCNGPWCPQSTRAIHRLIEMGYPTQKIKWYRGGIHSWNSLSLTTVAGN